MLKRFVLFGAGLLFLTACSIKKDAEEMKETTERVEKHAEHLSKRTDDLETEAVFDKAYEKTNEHLDLLFWENGKEGKRGYPANIDLMTYASSAIESMYFQFWKGDYYETVGVLDRRFALAVETFFVRVSKYIPRHFDVNRVDIAGLIPVRNLRPSREQKALGALGSQLHRMRPEYVEAWMIRHAKDPVSFYDAILLALKNGEALERTETLAKTVGKILEYKQEAIYLLQMRHNFLPVMVMARMGDFQNRGLGGQLRAWLFGQTVQLTHKDPSLSASPEQLKTWTEWLRQARQTRETLRAVGIEPRYNSTFVGLLKGLDFGQKEILSRPGAIRSGRMALEHQLAVEFEQVVGEM